MITAMTITAALIIIALTAAFAALAYATARVIYGDGYGHRRPPASHPAWFETENGPTWVT